MAGNTYKDFNAPKNDAAQRPANGGLKTPILTEVGYKTWCVNEFGCNNMYVLEGKDRALVVDAGMGYCNFREIVESLTDKPYDVVITHAHPDHIGMMHQFDRIYINKTEVDMARPMGHGGGDKGGMDSIRWLTRPDFNMDEFIWNNRLHIGHWEIWNPDESCINRGDRDTEICYIKEGDSFDLGGGRVVTAYNLPGHSPGHLYFIDEGEKMAFTGDCVNFNNGTRTHAASTHIRYLKRFIDQYNAGMFRQIFTGHSTYCGIIDVMSQDIRIVENLLEMHRKYLRGDPDLEYVDIKFHLFPDRPAQKGMAYGEGYTRVQVTLPPVKWEDGEEHIVP